LGTSDWKKANDFKFIAWFFPEDSIDEEAASGYFAIQTGTVCHFT